MSNQGKSSLGQYILNINDLTIKNYLLFFNGQKTPQNLLCSVDKVHTITTGKTADLLEIVNKAPGCSLEISSKLKFIYLLFIDFENETASFSNIMIVVL